MNVLPDAATLSSFFIVLICILLATVVIIANLQIFPSISLVQPQINRSLLNFISVLNPLQIASPLKLIFKGEWDRMLAQDYGSSKIRFHGYTYAKESWGHSRGYILVPLLFLIGLLQDLLLEWPRRELVHYSRLFRKPSTDHPFLTVKFKLDLLCKDLLRLLLLPLWIFWVTFAVLAIGVWILVFKISSSIRRLHRWMRFRRKGQVAINEEKPCLDY